MKLWARGAIATLAVISSACSADIHAVSHDLNARVVSEDPDRPAVTELPDQVVVTDGPSGAAGTDPEFGQIELVEPFLIDQGSAWDELLPTLASEVGDVLPDSEAFGPTWWFVATEDVEAKSIAPSADCPAQAAERPAGMRARFEMMHTFAPELYREGDLQLTVLHDEDSAVVAAYAASRAASVECIEAALSDDTSLIRITTDGLPEFATVAYRIEFESTGPDDDGIERSTDFVSIQLHHGNTFAEVRMNAIQPVKHPDWTNIEQEMLRIARTLDIDA